MKLDSIHNNSDFGNLKMHIFYILRHTYGILLQWAQTHYEGIKLRKHKLSSSNPLGNIIREKST